MLGKSHDAHTIIVYEVLLIAASIHFLALFFLLDIFFCIVTNCFLSMSRYLNFTITNAM